MCIRDRNLTDAQIKEITAKIKKLGDVRPLNIDDVDSIIKDFHMELTTPMLKPTEGEGEEEPLDITGEPASKKVKTK